MTSSINRTSPVVPATAVQQRPAHLSDRSSPLSRAVSDGTLADEFALNGRQRSPLDHLDLDDIGDDVLSIIDFIARKAELRLKKGRRTATGEATGELASDGVYATDDAEPADGYAAIMKQVIANPGHRDRSQLRHLLEPMIARAGRDGWKFALEVSAELAGIRQSDGTTLWDVAEAACSPSTFEVQTLWELVHCAPGQERAALGEIRNMACAALRSPADRVHMRNLLFRLCTIITLMNVLERLANIARELSSMAIDVRTPELMQVVVEDQKEAAWMGPDRVVSRLDALSRKGDIRVMLLLQRSYKTTYRELHTALRDQAQHDEWVTRVIGVYTDTTDAILERASES